MKFTLAALAATVLATAANAQFSINTPSNVVECEPTLLQWTGGVSPYFLAIVNGNSPSTTLENIGQVNGTSLTFNVNFASGTTLGLNLKDSTGASALSGPFPVGAGTNTACVGQGISTGAGPASTGSTPASTTGASTGSSTSTSPSTGSTGASTAGTSSHASGTTTSTSSASTTSSSNGAGPTARFAELGVAGIVGAVIAALVA